MRQKDRLSSDYMLSRNSLRNIKSTGPIEIKFQMKLPGDEGKKPMSKWFHFYDKYLCA